MYGYLPCTISIAALGEEVNPAKNCNEAALRTMSRLAHKAMKLYMGSLLSISSKKHDSQPLNKFHKILKNGIELTLFCTRINSKNDPKPVIGTEILRSK